MDKSHYFYLTLFTDYHGIAPWCYGMCGGPPRLWQGVFLQKLLRG
jgi:hypothetical protein